MTTDQQTRVDKLFEQAVELPENARHAFLEQACAGDGRLLTEVQSLLDHDRQAPGDFLITLPGSGSQSTAADSADDQLVGQHIGDFRILRRIATGGMGSVYEAEQEHPHRAVALKIMHSGLASKSAQRRFEHESEILGRLRHPNIAQIYQSGVWKEATLGPLPMPYFAMEHVPGARPITDYARDLRLDIRRRLELFIQVCDAVHHGHQKGVIHRDLKPSNILIDATGNVKVIDFGVARCTASDVAATTMHTCTGELVGTLQYMSPEQCEADPLGLDVRSDVYSLGVVLFELLTGGLPYDLSHKTIQACARMICDEPPVRPSTFDRHLKGNLDAILLRALDKNRDKRYASVLDLTQDVQRHLSGEPIDAKPPSLAGRAVRWAHRHPVATTALACAAVIALAAVATAMTVELGYRQPSHLTTLPDEPSGADIRELRVVSRLGTPLVTFGPYANPSMFSPTLLPAMRGSPWSHYLVVTFSNLLEELPTWRGKLCVFGVSSSRSEQPLWTSEVTPTDMPPGAASEGLFARDYWAIYAHPFDVFPEVPGTEIVACFASSQSRRLIRIYSIQGEVLYQFWNDGFLKPPAG